MSQIVPWMRYAIWKHVFWLNRRETELKATYNTLKQAEEALEAILIEDGKNGVTMWQYEIRPIYKPHPSTQTKEDIQ